jgi:hypothetical protein
MDEKPRKPWVNPRLTRLRSGSAELAAGPLGDGVATGHS